MPDSTTYQYFTAEINPSSITNLTLVTPISGDIGLCVVGGALKKFDFVDVLSGSGDMILASVQTVTGAKTFGTIGGAVGKFILAGSTSGSTIVNAAAVAGTTTMTLPTATTTLIGTGTTDTLTNKSIDGANNTVTNIGSAEIKADIVTGLTEEGSPASTDFLLGVESGGALRKFDIGNLPSSGADMLLASVQIVTGAKTFGTIGGAVSKFILAGSTSGSTIVDATAAAGGTITIPNATDTLTGKATTDTFTNKTIDADGTGNVITNIGSSEIKAEMVTGLTEEGSPASTDFLLGVESGGALRKFDIGNLPSGGGTPTVITVADESSDTTCFVGFFTAATGDLGPKSGTNLTFNSSTGAITATSFVGALTGNADTVTTITGLAPDTATTQATQASITTAANLVTVGALNSGSITSGFGSIDNGASAITTTGIITGGTVEATTDTAVNDNAAMGYTATEGLILTGQGSTNDITFKNDADTTVFRIPTGSTGVTFAGVITATSPSFTTPVLGTPSSGNLGSCTAYPGDSSLVTTGALDSGSITSNFGAIDNGISNITTGGVIGLDVDGTAINAAGSIRLGAAATDSAIYYDGTSLINDSVTTIDMQISGVSELLISATTIDFQDNTLTDIFDITSITSLNGVAIAGYALATGDVYTGVHDFGGASSFELPNAAAPTVNATGEIALDTTITDHTPLLRYYSGTEEMLVIAIPNDQLTSTDGHLISYNATDNEFEMVAAGATDNLGNHTATIDLVMGANAVTFGIDAAAPASSVTYVTALAAGLQYNAITGDTHNFLVNGTLEMEITPAAIDIKGNTFTLNTSQQLQTDAGGITYGVPTGDDHNFQVNAVSVALFDATGLTLAVSDALRFGAVDILSDSSGTMTLSNIDALDATTEATVEAAIDTLANLTSAAALATVGTITTGVWTGTAIASARLDSDTAHLGVAQTFTATKQFSTTANFTTEVDNGNSGAADTLDWTAGNKQKSTLTDNVTYTFSPAPDGPCSLILRLIQDATGTRTATWPATVKWPGGTAPTLTTTANAVDVVALYFDGTNYHCNFALDSK